MADWIGQEALIRGSAFAGALIFFLLLERGRPRVVSPNSVSRRLTNLAFSLLNTLVLRVCLPWLAVQFAVLAANRNLGLFHWLELPLWVNCLLSFLALDCLIYWQHRLFHCLPWLWRLHRVHHSDVCLDVTTAVRFHPVEALLSMGIKLFGIALLGADPRSVLIFELALSLGSIFSHANVRLATGADKWLRSLVVTPDMHRVHHSIQFDEMNRNFGFFLSIWDRLFGSYSQVSERRLLNSVIGLHKFRKASDQRFWNLLINPFER